MHIQPRDGGGAAAGMRGSHIAIRMCVCDVAARARGWVLTFVWHVSGRRGARGRSTTRPSYGSHFFEESTHVGVQLTSSWRHTRGAEKQNRDGSSRDLSVHSRQRDERERQSTSAAPHADAQLP